MGNDYGACLMLLRSTIGLATAASLVGAATVNLAQIALNPEDVLDTIVGSGGLVVVAVLIMRWTFRMNTQTQENAEKDRAAALEREKTWLTTIEHLSESLAEANAQLATERAIRLALEQQGLTERRQVIMPSSDTEAARPDET